jgi:hypothetical protein
MTEAEAVEAAFDQWIEDNQNAEYLASGLFQDRGERMFTWFESAKEKISVEQAAQFIGLPVDVFRYLYAAHLTMKAIEMGDPPSEALH